MNAPFSVIQSCLVSQLVVAFCSLASPSTTCPSIVVFIPTADAHPAHPIHARDQRASTHLL
jgi:hypothetical protein